jgi:hypothetical protein
MTHGEDMARQTGRVGNRPFLAHTLSFVPESFTGHGPVCSFGAPVGESLQRLVRQLFVDLKDLLLRWFPCKKAKRTLSSCRHPIFIKTQERLYTGRK